MSSLCTNNLTEHQQDYCPRRSYIDRKDKQMTTLRCFLQVGTAMIAAVSITTSAAIAYSGQACQPVHVPAAGATAREDNPPCGPTAACVTACLSIPESATRTGWTHYANPLGDGNWFRYTEVSSNFRNGNQEICYEAKNWSADKARDGQICVQFDQ
jgi:hypothetical protein